MLDKNRFLAITDAIIAVAATVMVLKLDIPEHPGIDAFLERWPTLLAYIISYFHIFILWHEHHDSFARAEKINHRVFLLNCVWLFFITLLPFVTGVVGTSPDNRLSVLLYVGILFLCQLLMMLESNYVNAINDTPMQDEDIIRRIRKESFACDAVAAAAAFVYPKAGIVIVLISSLWDVILVILYDQKKY